MTNINCVYSSRVGLKAGFNFEKDYNINLMHYVLAEYTDEIRLKNIKARGSILIFRYRREKPSKRYMLEVPTKICRSFQEFDDLVFRKKGNNFEWSEEFPSIEKINYFLRAYYGMH